jgi:hypothetical protein
VHLLRELRDVEALHPDFLKEGLPAPERPPVTTNRSPVFFNDHRFFLTGSEYAPEGMTPVQPGTSESVHWLAIAKSVLVNTI